MPRPRCFTGITKESFLLIHNCSEDFVLSKWSCNGLVYAVWASLCSIYTMSMVIISGLESDHGIKILIWLTYWSFYCLTLRFIVTACNTWLFVVYEGRDHVVNPSSSEFIHDTNTSHINGHSHATDASSMEPNGIESTRVQGGPEHVSSNGTNKTLNGLTHYAKRRKAPRSVSTQDAIGVRIACQWFLQNISNTTSLLVTILFWALIYTGQPQSFLSINSHVINSLLVISDIMISRAPVRVQHFYMPVMFLGIYIGFTLIYWVAGGTNHKGAPFIYSVLDYSSHPKTAAVAIILIALLAVPVTQTILYCLTWARNTCYSAARKRYFTPFRGQNIHLADIVAENGSPVCKRIDN